MAGRGGRGAALLQAMQLSMQKPGDAPEPVPTPTSVGRGGRGAKLLEALQSKAKQPVDCHGDDVTAKPIGRGISLLSQLTKRTSGEQQPQASPLRPSPRPEEQEQSDSLPTECSLEQSPKSSIEEALQRLAIDHKERFKPRELKKFIGETGTQIKCVSNYLKISWTYSHVGIFQYAVQYTPELDSRGMRCKLLSEHSDVIGPARIFNGAQLFIPKLLPDSVTRLRSRRPTDGAEVEIVILYVGVLPKTAYALPFNLLFKRVLNHLEMKMIGRHHYSPRAAIQVPKHNLELWPGFITSIHECDDGLLLLCDVSHKVLRLDNVHDIMVQLYQKNRNTFQESVYSMLIGQVVLTRYNNRTIRIDDISWDKNPRSTFTNHRGDEMSFVDYYGKQYGLSIRDLEQPLLVNHPKKRDQKETDTTELILLIPELCFMTGLTDEMRADFHVMKDLSQHTRLDPNQRQNSLRRFSENVRNNKDASKELSNWGLRIDYDLHEVMGRELVKEHIFVKRDTFLTSDVADWDRSMKGKTVISAARLDCWCIFFTVRCQSVVNNFISNFKSIGSQLGMFIADPAMMILKDDRTDTYLRAIKDSSTPSTQLVVTVFPSNRDDRYSAVKKLLYCELPIPSQCINSRTISNDKSLRSVCSKIALQINVKLGGELWSVNIPLKNILVIGIDVYHDATKNGRSVVAVVANMNNQMTRWTSRVITQGAQQELIDGLKLSVCACIRKYHEVNDVLPERVMVFRDGVGNGQMPVVSDHEVPQLISCWKHFGKEYCPKFSLIVVQKRINQRIFLPSNHGLGNPASGTVVDSSITRPDLYDFYLVSQHVRQGTVSPTHYVVLYDNSSFKPDHMQRLTYKLTHMYYNWPGTIRVPAPCQYAHKLAQMVGMHLHRNPDPALCDRLFYL